MSIKNIMLSNWAAVSVGAALLLVHFHWFVVTRADQRAEAVAGFGAAVVALGIFLAVRPFFREGIRRAIEEAAGKAMPPLIGFLASRGYNKKREAERPQALRDVIADRLGLVLIFSGTLLNGYSGPIARLTGWIFSM